MSDAKDINLKGGSGGLLQLVAARGVCDYLCSNTGYTSSPSNMRDSMMYYFVNTEDGLSTASEVRAADGEAPWYLVLPENEGPHCLPFFTTDARRSFNIKGEKSPLIAKELCERASVEALCRSTNPTYT
jgi:hypothetical protein